jgi:hypothetical protein
MENTTHNALPNTLSNSVPVVDISANIKDSDFHTFLKQEFGNKADPFINWARNTQLEDKITQRKLAKLVLLYEGNVDFDLVAKAVALDPAVQKEMSDVFSGKVINVAPSNGLLPLPSDKQPTVDISEGVKAESFHAFLKEQFGDKAEPFINWSKSTQLADKITPRKLEKLVLLYAGEVDFNLVTKAVALDELVIKEMSDVFSGKFINTLPSDKKPSVDISEGIKNGDFHIILKEQFGSKADPFIEWAKTTKLEDKITPRKLEKLVLLYEGNVDFDLVAKSITLDAEVKNEIFNIFEDQKMNAQVSKIIQVRDSMQSSGLDSSGSKPKI